MITCREATEWLLEADLDELQSTGDRAIARHVAACSVCAARAARILGDTAWLARTVPAVVVAPAGHTRWARATFVATALVAASILVLLLARSPRADGRADSSQPRTAAASGTAQPAATESGMEHDLPAPSPSRHSMPLTRPPASSAPGRQLSSAVAVAPLALAAESVPAVATPALRLDTPHDRDSTRIEARPSLAVDVVPSTGRYAVLGSTPRVTVVWFY
jgi:hypothetical protein